MRAVRVGLALATAALLAGCGGGHDSAGSADHHAGMSMSRGMSMDHGDMGTSGDGLAASADGYTFRPIGSGATVTFRIDRGDAVLTAFQPEQTKLMHFYLIRSDLTGFQHLHPTMNAAGTWTVTPTALAAGRYRMYVQFQPRGADAPVVLSRPLTVPGRGAGASTPVPAAGTTATADGYTVTLAGAPRAGTAAMLTLRFARVGRPVTDLRPYLDTFAHVTAIRAGTLAFAHLHPEGPTATGTGGPTLHLHAVLPEPGTYRMFIQFRTGGTLHTAPLTVRTTG